MKKNKVFWGLSLGFTVLLFACGPSGGSEQGKGSEGSEKSKLVSSLVGVHSLTGISGVRGANGEFEYTASNGKWSGMESYLVGGQRSSDRLPIDRSALSKLNSMHILVDCDLSVNVVCEGKYYLTSLYKPDSMSYSLKVSPKDLYNAAVPESINPGTTFLEDYLYFFVADGIPENAMGFADFIGTLSDGAVLRYNIKNQHFELGLFSSEMGESVSLDFSKRSVDRGLILK